jgi:hypothetical protein
MPIQLFQTRFYFCLIIFCCLYGCAKSTSSNNNNNNNNNNNDPSGSTYSLSFDLMIAWHQAGTNSCFLDNYTDSGFMRVDIVNDIVTISNIVNQSPNTTPKSGPDKEGIDVCTWIPDTVGMINIKGATGVVSPLGNVASGIEKRVLITCDTSAYTIFPLWSVASQGTVNYSGGYNFPANPMLLGFIMKDQVQDTTITSPPTGIGLEADARILVTPKH